MKHVAEIEPAIRRTFTLPLELCDGALLTFDEPAAPEEWHPLPERFLPAVELASKFIGSSKGQSSGWWKVDYAHLFSGRVIATNNKAAVEIEVGQCHIDLTLTAKQVRMIKAFGAAPSQAAYCGTTDQDRSLHFGWANGSHLVFERPKPPSLDLGNLFAPYDWTGFEQVEEDWRDQVLGHFSFKPVRGNTGLVSVYPDRITSGIFDNRPDTELRVETGVGREVEFEKAIFLNAVKVAAEKKFVHDGDHSRLLFKGENVRGVVVSRHRVRT